MRIDQFTQKSQDAIASAQQLAATRGHPEVRPLHLVHALLEDGQTTIHSLFAKLGVDVARTRAAVDRELGRLPQSSGGNANVSRPLMDVLTESNAQAERLKDEYVSTEHLLLALLSKGSDAAGLLQQAGLSTDKVLGVLKDIRGNQRVTDQNPEAKY
ncbi:MAG: type VI secretion system ATPase TssH, partial [Proteobacteria bacterium]